MYTVYGHCICHEHGAPLLCSSIVYKNGLPTLAIHSRKNQSIFSIRYALFGFAIAVVGPISAGLVLHLLFISPLSSLLELGWPDLGSDPHCGCTLRPFPPVPHRTALVVIRSTLLDTFSHLPLLSMNRALAVGPWSYGSLRPSEGLALRGAGFCPHCQCHAKRKQHGMTDESRIQQIRDWLAECLDTHQACKWDDLSPPLPTRVLQLDLEDGSDDVRLVDGQDKEGKYAALSYRWGPSPDAIFKTNSTNLGQNQSRIGFAKLNLLFREVIKILRPLGVMYLWIDALCIVQDSTNDWETEASKMASVYSNAYLTMSASESESPDNFKTPQYPISSPDIGLKGLRSVIQNGALSKRGWCLQERCLSRRIVHLGSDQMCWECPGATHDEHVRNKYLAENAIGPGERIMLGPRGFLNDDLQGRGMDPYGLWYAILTNYGSRSLSFEKDRIPALSGLIDLFKRATGDSMVSGVWRADVPRGLLWYSWPPPQCDNCIEAHGPTTVPSWSWLRAHGISRLISTLLPPPGAAASIQIVSLDESNMTITLQGTLFGCPFGSCGNGSQRVICGSYEINPGISYKTKWDFHPECIGRWMTHGWSEGPSNGAEASAAMWVLVIYEPQAGDSGWGLMMVREAHSETYRRVGLVKIYHFGWLGQSFADWGPDSVNIQYLRQEPRTQTIKLR